MTEQRTDDVQIVVLPEEILSTVDTWRESSEVIDTQPLWLIEGVFRWCAREGDVQPETIDETEKQRGMTLLVPGMRYAITLRRFTFDILKAGVPFVIDLIIGNPLAWTKGATAASALSIMAILDNFQKVSEDERRVLIALGRIKKQKYRGIRRNPSREDLGEDEELKPIQDEIDTVSYVST